MSEPTSGIDLFDGIDDAAQTEESESENATDSTSDSSDSSDTSEDAPVETFASIPDGCMSVTEFAGYMSMELMKARIAAGEDPNMATDYVVPQSVYQTVKASKERIPHVLVKGPDDTGEPRVYIKVAEATEWWKARRDRLATRGSGTTRASNRTPEDNLTLLGAAVGKNLYALSRQSLWNDNVEQTAKLVDKYKGFLKDANVDEDSITLAIQEATDKFNTEQAAKEAEKKAKKEKPAEAPANA